jgi:hypothetical protein
MGMDVLYLSCREFLSGHFETKDFFAFEIYKKKLFKGVYDSDLIKALEAIKMLQIDTG